MVTMIRSDLDFILAQIKIAEADARGEPLLGTYIPNSELPWGLRRVDGSNNNLLPGQGGYGAADQPFVDAVNGGTPLNERDNGMRFGPPMFQRNPDGSLVIVAGQPVPTPGFEGGVTADGIVVPVGYAAGVNFLANNNYGVHTPNDPAITNPRAIQPGDVVDADPRTISNLIVDQTANNPAAVYKALQVAGVADPFGAMESVTTAVNLIKSEKAELAPLQSAANSALAAYNQVLGANQAQIAAYGIAATASEQLRTMTGPAAAAAVSALVVELGAMNAATTAADDAALAAAQQAIDAMIADVSEIVTALTPYPGANLSAATSLLGTLQQMRDDLGSINLDDGTVDTTDMLLATGVVDDVTNLDLTTFDGQIDTGLAALNAQVANALNALNAASGALAAANGEVTAAEGALRTLLTDTLGVAIEESPDGNILKGTLLILNVAPDAGLSSPFNGWMTLFGQFFDHGLDLVGKGGFGTVYIPLERDDPLFVEGGNSNFMALTRSTLENGQAINKVTPFVDQNQTYTSNASAQVFHREYEMRDGKPVATGRLLNGADGGLATWGDIKKQAIEKLGIELNDRNIHDIPELVVDFYGNFIPGANGFPQLVRSIAADGTVAAVSGNATTAVRTADGMVSTGHAFLDDIAHHASPSNFDADPSPSGYTAKAQVADADFDRTGDGKFDLADLDANGDNAFTAADLSVDLGGGLTIAGMVADTNNDGAITVADFDRNNSGTITFADFDVNGDGAITSADMFANDGNGKTYDNEMLDRHFITGDGRGNENIGLTAVHHVFHSEHNRQIELIKDTVVLDGDLAFINEWLDPADQLDAAGLAAILAIGPGDAQDAAIDALTWNGERLFQAAKFPTEMQYQHLVFEEFARTVQPFVNVFNDYDGQLNPAILSEFAHTVYRFGHSMLNETVDRLDVNNQVIGSGGIAGPTQEQIGLIEAFLNPIEFNANGLTAEQSAGAIARGMTRQRGNEIDEFVTEALRNNLVGLPLDLATLNIARGRELNVPTLNEARAEFYAGSGDTQVKPYLSWAEFAANLKNPASIINFIAAYGKHETITSVSTVEAKRAAATKLVLGDSTLSGDAKVAFDNSRYAFLNSSTFNNGTTGTGDDTVWTALNSGLNDVDFWVGGLAEEQMAFGGMLGTTFNFVFEVQMEALQNGDRFYYLSRLANLNLTAQLENNKFAEMIARNTDADHLPGNVFKAMDFQLEADISRQLGEDPTGGADDFLGAITQKVVRVAPTGLDPNGDYDTYLEFNGGEHVVLGGTSGRDILVGDEGDDTLWGDGGDDRLEGGIGNDFFFGGDGNDIITDQFGDDEVRSGAGNDVVNAGQGINLIITDLGNDFVWGGPDDEEFLLGQGDDYAAGGAGIETILGGEGNDWLESGLENGLLLGDNGDLIQGLPIKRSVDSPIIGNDVLVATGGNADFDAESGDDIMIGGLGTDRFFGAFGFDWAVYKNDPTGLEADMANRLFSPPSIAGSPGAILDRYAQTESLSGSRFTDFLRGDDETDLAGGGADLPPDALTVGIPPDNALKDSNVAMIAGLDAFLGSINEEGENRFSGGNILLGGAGSDVMEGRGGNDLIDGDRWLDAQIKVVHNGVTEFYNGMGERAVGAPANAPTLQERMFSGEIGVAELEIYRSIKTDGVNVADIDVAQFTGVRADYAVATVGGITTVTHLVRDADGAIIDGAIGADGVDRLTNVERILFSDQTIALTTAANSAATGAGNNRIATGVVTISSSLPNAPVGSVLTANLGGIVDSDGLPIFTGPDAETARFTVFWQVELVAGSGEWSNIQSVVADEFAPVTGTTFTLTAAEAGLNVRALVRFKDDEGAVETLVSLPAASGAGVNAAPVAGDPAAVLGPDLQGQIIDGVEQGLGTFGIVEDSGAFTFTAAQLLANITDPNGDTVTIAPGSVVLRLIDGRPFPGTLTTDALPFTDPAKTFTFTPALNFNGGVTFTYEVTDGVNDPVPAEATLDVLAVNDAVTGASATPGDAISGVLTVGAVIAQLVSTDVDANDRGTFALAAGTDFTVTPNGALTVAAVPTVNEVNTLNLTVTDEFGAVATETIRVRAGSAAGQTIDGTDAAVNGDDIIFGLAGADTLNGLGGDDMLIGGQGADTLNGGLGNDTVIWSVGDGNGAARDVVNGGLAGTDTFVVNGNGAAEVYRVFSNMDDLNPLLAGLQTSAAAAGLTGLAVGTEIVITRNTNGIAGAVTNTNIVATLNGIEEIVINTGAGIDTVAVVGDFTPTNLAFNTIHVNNSGDDDTVDVSERDSDHRVVLTSSGTGNGRIIGQGLRDQIIDGDSEVAPPTDEDETDDEDNEDNDNEDTSGIDEDNDSQDESEDDDETVGSGSGSGTGGSGTGSGALPHVMFAGTLGDDAVFGGAGDDRLAGAGGNDSMFGDDGDDNIVADAGNDDVFAGNGADIVSGGTGNDRLFGDAGDDVMLGGAGNDRIMAGDGNDRIWGDAGRDVINGGLGNDVIFAIGGDGNDIIHGDGGEDTVNYEEITGPLLIDLDAGIARSEHGGEDVLSGIENAVGGSGANTFYANDDANVLTAGGGHDTFVFRTAADARGDTIKGFEAGDTISLSQIFGSTPMTFQTGAFNAAGQIRLVADADGNTKIEGSTNGDDVADFSILVTDHLLKTDNIT